MLTEYIRAAMRHAKYEILEEGTFFGTIPGLKGLWANGQTLEACREELQSTLEDWILVRVRLGHEIPAIDDIDLNVNLTEATV